MEVRIASRYLVGLLLFLSLANVALAAYVHRRYTEPPPPADLPLDQPAQIPSGGSERVLPEMGRPAAKTVDLELIVQKNLFHPGRSKVEKMPEKAEAASRPVDARNLQVLGVFLDGKKAKALLSNRRARKDEKKTAWLSEGESLWGLKVLRIEREKVVVESEGTELELGLYEDVEARDRGQALEPKEAAPEKEVVTVAPEKVPAPEAPTEEKPGPVPAGAAREGEEQQFRVINTPFGKVKRPVSPGGETGPAPARPKSLPFPTAPPKNPNN
jgi:hypothetical protein